ncbi:MAG TPA: type II toxin-antitoxin system VapB family antitoxin [Oligoflexia bacterium]|nr:type II toxin-antitoxin system VapB family antitoxin [Oligoflexia bacterium]HMP49378.1 type II toxin-antitoxin system VapB family antitoxin [Oligoflexia bacterium]
MKRTNLILDENLLNTASRLFGEKTYSDTVNRALDEAIKAVKIRGILDFRGSGLWEGALSEMRDDKPKRKTTKK